jgi:hypothetical protein
MTRRYGRYPRGRRPLSPWQQSKTTTFVAAPFPGEVTVHCGLDGLLGAESFRPDIEQCVERRAQV